MGGADDWLPLSGIQHFCFCRRQANSTTPAVMTQTRPNGAAACSSPEGCRWSAVGWA